MKSIKERSVSQRGDGHVLARHRAELVVVSGADRDPGADDRGLRRGHGRPAGRRGLPRLAAQAEADAGLEDHQGHRRRRLCPAAARQGHPVERRPGAGEAGRRGRHPQAAQSVNRPIVNRQSPAVEPGTGFYEYRFAPAEIKPKLGEITVKKVDAGRRLGQRALAVPRGHEQGHALRRHAAEAEEDALTSRSTPPRARCWSRSTAR